MDYIQERENKYAFIVEKSANKNQIKDAIEKKFDVLVSKVATMNIDGKLKNMTTRSNGRTIRTQGRRSSYKKTIITLEEGYTIDFVRSEVEV